ncbi:MAG: hypothetical protein ABIO04_10795 [Ferruginibacter sp.]
METANDNKTLNKIRIIFFIALVEYFLFIFSGSSFSFLQGDNFFSIEVDPLSWGFYLAGMPQFILKHQWCGILIDSIIIISLLLFVRDPLNNRLAILLFLLLMLFYITFMGHMAHRNYQVGFFMVFVPFLFKGYTNKIFAYESLRYFLLFFYLSAAFLKITNHSLAGNEHFSHLLSGQFTPYFLEGNTGVRTDLNLYLISHPATSHLLFIISFIVELTTIIGFFTKRFDNLLAIALLTFHFGNWLIMDIAPFGQVAFICLLFISREMTKKKPNSF